MRRGLILYIILTLISQFLLAQIYQTVRIDAYSRRAVQAAPFDRYFYLLLPVDSTVQIDEIAQLNLYQIRGKRKSPDQKTTLVKIYLSEELQKSRFVDTPKENGFKYIQIFIDTQFLPHTRFYAVLTLKASYKYLEKFNKINQDIYSEESGEAQKEYQELTTGLLVKYSNTKIQWPSFETYKKYFQDSIKIYYTEINNQDSTILKNMRLIRDSLDSSGFKITDLFTCNCQRDFVANELFADSTKFLIPLQNLTKIPEALKYFSLGRLNIQEFESYRIVSENDLQKRIDNLVRLKNSLINISYFFHLSSFAEAISQSQKKAIYNSVLEAVRSIDKLKDILTEARINIRKQLNAMNSLGSAELSFGGTSPAGEDIQTASGHFIIADFGLSGAGTFVNNQFGFLARPYIGVNFSFIAIDKNQPLRAIENKIWLHRLSAVLGLTTVQLSRQGTYDLIKNMSVVAGIALRASRAFRFTFGVLVYKRDNANPVLPQIVTVGPMTAISLDLDVAHWLNDLKNKLY